MQPQQAERHTFAYRSGITDPIRRNHAAIYRSSDMDGPQSHRDMKVSGTCSSCPHPGGCASANACLDEFAAIDLATSGSTRLMVSSQANSCMAALREGKTVRKITSGGKWGKPIVHIKKFRRHCAAYAEWGDEAKRLAAANLKTVRAWIGTLNRSRTHCIRGHDLKDARVYFWRGETRRQCRKCDLLAHHRGGIAKPEAIEKAISALRRGSSVTSLTKAGTASYVLKHSTLQRHRREHPNFDRLVIEAMRGALSRGQMRRRQRYRNERVRDQVNDYYRIRNMVPAGLPEHVRDDITQNVMMAMLEGSLLRSEVQIRIKMFITEHYRLFPTKFAKFGDSLLVSLDQVLFEDSSMTRGETVSQGLWD
ncbi:MAG: hypothetical protein JWR80_4820 [Bradyrhizobium sp.]|nr:hypothetical protein [Bradyrhizobium sp.]